MIETASGGGAIPNFRTQEVGLDHRLTPYSSSRSSGSSPVEAGSSNMPLQRAAGNPDPEEAHRRAGRKGLTPPRVALRSESRTGVGVTTLSRLIVYPLRANRARACVRTRRRAGIDCMGPVGGSASGPCSGSSRWRESQLRSRRRARLLSSFRKQQSRPRRSRHRTLLQLAQCNTGHRAESVATFLEKRDDSRY
jgi:hypothetical protein